MKRILAVVLLIVGLAALIVGGAYFALKRPDLPFETLAAKYENLASRYIELPAGVRMHYRDQGRQEVDAPVLLLIHGYSASLHTWEPWVARLGDGYRIVSLDLPGHGLTRAPDDYEASIESLRDAIAAFVREQDFGRFAIAGSSMGGNIAWQYALAHPEQIDALILVDAAGWPDARTDAGDEPAIFRLLRNPVAGPLMRDLDNTSLIRRGLEASFYDPTLVDDAMTARYSELSRLPGHRDILLQLMLNHRSRALASDATLAAIRAPTLILHGDADRLVAPEAAQRFNRAIAGSRLVIFENTGHVPQEEKPEQSAAAVRAFLDSVYARPAAPTSPPPARCAAGARC